MAPLWDSLAFGHTPPPTQRLGISPVERGVDIRPDEALASLHEPPDARER